VATRIFGITGRLDALEGERDQNYRLISEDGRCFVLKVSGAGEDTGIVDFQIRALEHLEREAPHIPAPRVVQTLEGETTAQIEGPDGSCHEVRLLTYLPGIPYGNGVKPSRKGLAAIGAFGGALAKTLASFDHASAQHFTPWDMNNGLLGSEVLWRYGYQDIIAFEQRLRPQFAKLFSERLKNARRQVAHFDLHQENLLRPCDQDEVVSGVIDFGDMVHGPLACDAAIIAASFAALDNPVESMTAVVSGYHQVVV